MAEPRLQWAQARQGGGLAPHQARFRQGLFQFPPPYRGRATGTFVFARPDGDRWRFGCRRPCV